MNVLLLTGVFEELRPFQAQHPFEFVRKIRAFRSQWYPNLFAATTGPGLRRRAELKKILDAVRPGCIVNAGLVGILGGADSSQAGDRLRISAVKRAADGIIYPGGPGRDLLLTVREPVFHPAEKEELALCHGARACDMEAGELLALVSQTAAWRPYGLRVVLCKVAGDLPADYELFANEHLTRGWESWGRGKRLWAMVRFPGGPRRLLRLIGYRRTVLEELTRHIHRTLKPILDSDGTTDTNDSVFQPE